MKDLNKNHDLFILNCEQTREIEFRFEIEKNLMIASNEFYYILMGGDIQTLDQILRIIKESSKKSRFLVVPVRN